MNIYGEPSSYAPLVTPKGNAIGSVRFCEVDVT